MSSGEFDTQSGITMLNLEVGGTTLNEITITSHLLFLCYCWVCIVEEGGLLSQKGNTKVKNGSSITKKTFLIPKLISLLP